MKNLNLPWEFKPGYDNNMNAKLEEIAGTIRDNDGWNIARIWASQPNHNAEAKAVLIVKAVNNHEQLLEACRGTLDIINSYSHVPAIFKACEILQVAIAATEGRESSYD